MQPITYRAASLDDAALASDLMTASYPPLPQDPVITRYHWENPRHGYEFGRYIAERDGRGIGFLGWYHGPWAKLPNRHCEVEVWLDKAHLDDDVLQSMWAWIGDQAVAQGSRTLLAYCGEDEPEMLEALAALGYNRERAEKVWELDLAKHGARLTREAEAERLRMDGSGIRLLTVAGWDDADKLQKLFALNEQTIQDVPHSLPIVPEAFADFEKRAHAPDRRLDRYWIAVDGDRVIAMSYLKFPPVRGTVWTGFTCTDREYRGRGIARAVKLQSLAQAASLGVPVVCTDNDSENAPMLHINETLGYTRRPGFVEHHKRVESSRGAGN
ncbi:MAG TPA: GNAT family N-acetyltransferase [Candidatus Dormibacteraeota bacterium]|nr:GNAT family N-acetyltransferase [Candidatus Dormibacteraeota bacterium]